MDFSSPEYLKAWKRTPINIRIQFNMPDPTSADHEDLIPKLIAKPPQSGKTAQLIESLKDSVSNSESPSVLNIVFTTNTTALAEQTFNRIAQAELQQNGDPFFVERVLIYSKNARSTNITALRKALEQGEGALWMVLNFSSPS